MMKLNDVPMFAADMNANNIHVFVGKNKIKLPMVRGFKRIENGYLAVRFLPASHEGQAIIDTDDILESICFIENAIIGRMVHGEVIDIESTIVFDSDKE